MTTHNDKSRADALTEDQRQALGEALTEYFVKLDSDEDIHATDGRILRSFDYHDSRNIDDLIDRAIAPAIAASPHPVADDAAGEPVAWQTGTPPTKGGDHNEYIVAVRRKAVPDRVFVFASNYANNYGKEELIDQDGDEYIADGWYTIGHDTSGEFDSLFMPMLEPGDEVIGWQALPKWDGAAVAQAGAPEPEPRAEVTGDDKLCAERYRWLRQRGEVNDRAIDAARAGEAR